MSRQEWSEEENQFIVTHYQTMTCAEIGRALHRTTSSVQNRRHILHTCRYQAARPIKIGDRFGRLTVLKEHGRNPNNHHLIVLCQCQCGIILPIDASSLVTKTTQSCGCLRIDRARNIPGAASWGRLYIVCKNGAKARNISFELSLEEFMHLSSQNCKYCGIEPCPWNCYIRPDGTNKASMSYILPDTIDRAWIKANGVDRVDNHLGYSVLNCAAACTICNQAKHALPLQEFYEWVRRISKFNGPLLDSK